MGILVYNVLCRYLIYRYLISHIVSDAFSSYMVDTELK